VQSAGAPELTESSGQPRLRKNNFSQSLESLPRSAAVSAQSLVARSNQLWLYLNCFRHCCALLFVGPQRRAENVALNVLGLVVAFDLAGLSLWDACGVLSVPL